MGFVDAALGHSLLSQTPQGSSPLRGVCPEDFRMAQVAQDEVKSLLVTI